MDTLRLLGLGGSRPPLGLSYVSQPSILSKPEYSYPFQGAQGFLGSWITCALMVFVMLLSGTRAVADCLLYWTLVRLLNTHWVWGDSGLHAFHLCASGVWVVHVWLTDRPTV